MQPLSSPPAGYFEQLPTRIMAQVAVPARRPLLMRLWQAPMYVRTGLASTVLLGTFAASMWLGSAPLSVATPSVALDAVPQQQLVDYLTSGETHLDMLDLAELPTRHLGITRQYLHSSPTELTEALDAQPTEGPAML
ncbi:hypothetical protein A0257_00170 [Hymenobacter psoromatis]|nr:hypothetical protein A0257_00170 [Hymenobacter psoromatis]